MYIVIYIYIHLHVDMLLRIYTGLPGGQDVIEGQFNAGAFPGSYTPEFKESKILLSFRDCLIHKKVELTLSLLHKGTSAAGRVVLL